MMRSESRTDEISGLVTTIAWSANRIASTAPRSMPAGLSQITQSKVRLSSRMTRSTPSSVSASLSRVCEAAKRCSVLTRLSRITACVSLASPLRDVDEVIDDPPLRAHHEVEVAQPNVEIDDAHALAALRERRADRGGRRGFAHPAFS